MKNPTKPPFIFIALLTLSSTLCVSTAHADAARCPQPAYTSAPHPGDLFDGEFDLYISIPNDLGEVDLHTTNLNDRYATYYKDNFKEAEADFLITMDRFNWLEYSLQHPETTTFTPEQRANLAWLVGEYKRVRLPVEQCEFNLLKAAQTVAPKTQTGGNVSSCTGMPFGDPLPYPHKEGWPSTMWRPDTPGSEVNPDYYFTIYPDDPVQGAEEMLVTRDREAQELSAFLPQIIENGERTQQAVVNLEWQVKKLRQWVIPEIKCRLQGR